MSSQVATKSAPARRPRRAAAPRATRLVRGKKEVVVASVLLIVITAYAVFVPLGTGGNQLADLSSARQAPSPAHWFGTNSLGQDLFVRVALGLRTSLVIALVCALSSAVIGAFVGAVAATLGGWVDTVLMRLADATNALPHLLLGIVVVAMFRGSMIAIVASIVITHWPPVARLVRSEAMTIREMEYVDAAYLSGARRRDVLRRHVAPATLGQVVIAVTLTLPHAISHESALSFLGLGLSPDRPSLGTLLENARGEVLLGNWWTLVFPAAPLVLVTWCVAVLGGALQRRFSAGRTTEEIW